MVSIGIIGKKIGMTQIFNNKGFAIPVTIIKAGPCIVTQIKKGSKNNCESIQIGYSFCKENKLTQSQLGHLKKNNLPPVKFLKEFQVSNLNKFFINQHLTVNIFSKGDFIDITAKSIGKGFTGNQKRHNFKRGPMSHGSKNHRAPGSIGAGTTPGRVFPGKKMSGKHGSKQVTIKNLEIMAINEKNNLLILKGSLPGKQGNLVHIIESKKKVGK